MCFTRHDNNEHILSSFHLPSRIVKSLVLTIDRWLQQGVKSYVLKQLSAHQMRPRF